MARQEIRQDQIRDRNYKGWARLASPSPLIETPKPFGKVIGPDPELDGYYHISLATPAIDKRTGEKLPVIREAADNLKRIRYDRKTLTQLIEEKGLKPGEYACFFTTGEGDYFLSRPGYFTETESGSLVTKDGKHYFWWMDWDEENKRMKLDTWEEEQPQSDWKDDPEYKRALQILENRAKKTATLD